MPEQSRGQQPSIESLIHKVDSLRQYQESAQVHQERFNNQFAAGIEKLTSTMVKIDVYNERTNNLGQRIDVVSNIQSEDSHKVNERLSKIEDKLATHAEKMSAESQIVDELKTWKRLIVGLFAASIIGGIVALVMPSSQTEAVKTNNKLIEKLIEKMDKQQ